MKTKGGAVLAAAALAVIVAVIATDFDSLSDGGSSPDDQRLRMYAVFAAYLGLLFAVRAALKREPQAQGSSATKIVKVVVGAIGVAGASFIVAVVMALVIGGVGALEAVMAKMVYIVPALALVAAPLLMKRMR